MKHPAHLAGVIELTRRYLTKRLSWRFVTKDTLARRFAGTVAVAVIVAISLNFVFVAVAGVWAKPSADELGLLDRADDVVRMIEATPASSREVLAQAATSKAFQVGWDSPASTVAVTLDIAADLQSSNEPANVRRFTDAAHPHRAVYFDWANPGTKRATLYHHSNAHYLAVELADHGWVVFTALSRSWGLRTPVRFGIGIAFLIVSIIAVSAVATYRLARPITGFANALTRFGADPRADALPQTGPSELREAVRAFNAMQSRIQRFVEDRTAMLAAISHDLRTPLTRMRLRAELLDDTAQRLKLCQDVDDMQVMVDSALAFFRDDFQAEETCMFSFPELLQTVVEDYTDREQPVFYKGPEKLAFRGRPIALKRAVTNLIDNAILYGNTAEMALERQDGAAIVHILDRGSGIPETMIDRVFQPFYRLERSRNRATGGVGLGLTSARAVISAHGGEILLRNRAEGGLEVTVSLPIL